jgi:hypothetical protein
VFLENFLFLFFPFAFSSLTMNRVYHFILKCAIGKINKNCLSFLLNLTIDKFLRIGARATFGLVLSSLFAKKNKRRFRLLSTVIP